MMLQPFRVPFQASKGQVGCEFKLQVMIAHKIPSTIAEMQSFHQLSVTEENDTYVKGTKVNTMTQNTLLWVPCLTCQWSCQMELLFKKNTKQQSYLHTEGFHGHKNWLFG